MQQRLRVNRKVRKYHKRENITADPSTVKSSASIDRVREVWEDIVAGKVKLKPYFSDGLPQPSSGDRLGNDSTLT